jgi:hypothetical protein
VVLPIKLRGGAAHNLVAKLIDHSLIEEVRAWAVFRLGRMKIDHDVFGMKGTQHSPMTRPASFAGLCRARRCVAARTAASRQHGDRGALRVGATDRANRMVD